jgi:hypothetical protein
LGVEDGGLKKYELFLSNLLMDDDLLLFMSDGLFLLLRKVEATVVILILTDIDLIEQVVFSLLNDRGVIHEQWLLLYTERGNEFLGGLHGGTFPAGELGGGQQSVLARVLLV